MFHESEVPIAISMIQLSEIARHPFQKYFSLWAAFNNVYSLIGRHHGLVVRHELDNKGNARTEQRWGYTFNRVIIPSEKQILIEAVNQLDNVTKDTLIKHENIRFFVDRTPRGVKGNRDSAGQLINGVLNIARTVDPNLPIWSPIDKPKYEKYITGEDASSRSILAEQIVFMLYTIRNNLVHGSKNMDEANDIEVVNYALPLLEVIIRSFIHYR